MVLKLVPIPIECLYQLTLILHEHVSEIRQSEQHLVHRLLQLKMNLQEKANGTSDEVLVSNVL